MDQDLVLVAETGRETGTRVSRRLRRDGRIPATVYGMGKDPQTVSVEWRALRRALTTASGTNALIDLDLGGTRQPAIVKDIQRHPTRRDVLHIDFLRVDPDIRVDTVLQIDLVGEAHLVRTAGGIVEQLLHSVTISAKPGDVPNVLAVDVTELPMGGQIKVGDLVLPAGVTIGSDPDEVVAQTAMTAAGLAAAGGDANNG
jgi:large subunit ribosomal protein L25